jgi:hypothetical protein
MTAVIEGHPRRHRQRCAATVSPEELRSLSQPGTWPRAWMARRDRQNRCELFHTHPGPRGVSESRSSGPLYRRRRSAALGILCGAMIEIRHRATGEVLLVLSARSLSGTNLRGIDLAEADLRGADLRETNLGSASLRGVDLDGANLSGAYLRFADLTSASLRGVRAPLANFSGACLEHADLTGADLQETDLSFAQLSTATLCGAKLRGAYLHSVDLRGAVLAETDLRDAELECASLEEVEHDDSTQWPDAVEFRFQDLQPGLIPTGPGQGPPRPPP